MITPSPDATDAFKQWLTTTLAPMLEDLRQAREPRLQKVYDTAADLPPIKRGQYALAIVKDDGTGDQIIVSSDPVAGVWLRADGSAV